jgi:hypothetical protein
LDCGGSHGGSGGKWPMPAKSDHYLDKTMAQEVRDDAAELVQTLVGHWRERGGGGGAPCRRWRGGARMRVLLLLLRCC